METIDNIILGEEFVLLFKGEFRPNPPPQELDFRVLVGFIFSSLNEKGNNCFIIKKNVGSPRMGKLSMKCTPTVVMGKGVYLVNLDRKEWWSGKYLKAPV